VPAPPAAAMSPPYLRPPSALSAASEVGFWLALVRSTPLYRSIWFPRPPRLTLHLGTLVADGRFGHRRCAPATSLTAATPPYSSLLFPRISRALARTCSRDPPLCRYCQALLRPTLTVVAHLPLELLVILVDILDYPPATAPSLLSTPVGRRMRRNPGVFGVRLVFMLVSW
jgi:hypothetical protein